MSQVKMHIDAHLKQELKMQNYIDGLEELNDELSEEVKAAISDKLAELKSNKKAKDLAGQRLQKWHDERNKRRQAEDELAWQHALANIRIPIQSHNGTFFKWNLSDSSMGQKNHLWDKKVAGLVP